MVRKKSLAIVKLEVPTSANSNLNHSTYMSLLKLQPMTHTVRSMKTPIWSGFTLNPVSMMDQQLLPLTRQSLPAIATAKLPKILKILLILTNLSAVISLMFTSSS